MGKKYISTIEVANTLHVNRATVVKWILDGKIKAIRAGKIYRIDIDDFNDFVEKSKVRNK